MNYEQKLEKEKEIIDKFFTLLCEKENQEGFKLTFNKRGRKDAERIFKTYLNSMIFEVQRLDYDYKNQSNPKSEPIFTDSEISDMINEALNKDL